MRLQSEDLRVMPRCNNYMPVITINMSKLITKKILVYTKGVKCPSEQIGRILDVQHHPHVNVKDDLKAQFKQVDFIKCS